MTKRNACAEAQRSDRGAFYPNESLITSADRPAVRYREIQDDIPLFVPSIHAEIRDGKWVPRCNLISSSPRKPDPLEAQLWQPPPRRLLAYSILERSGRPSMVEAAYRMPIRSREGPPARPVLRPIHSAAHPPDTPSGRPDAHGRQSDSLMPGR